MYSGLRYQAFALDLMAAGALKRLSSSIGPPRRAVKVPDAARLFSIQDKSPAQTDEEPKAPND